ncbi:hypothetical protein GOP47_0015552 [Adiantum capillus-veneris]|uniref:Heterokaryon incompatibility domain-containing protein n=1 Tax=Adiantum capillus-veneris TaxID=13818 RepID=A0A9D4ZE28_ADICA|nr:hypothetical protein GOP47_0015552 [Adiantum capillus-veneris]
MAEAPLCGHQQQMIPADHWPLRLIDIASTLASGGGVVFITKNDWDFHVISHTWSLSIREFSKEVGRSLSGQIEGTQEYSDAFARSDFSNQSGYQDLLEFLQILMGDGVKYVWFDALCINQMDEVEKGTEIMHMGAYYKYSSGCYVVNHGIGQGYDLLGLDERTGEACLPRWFTRIKKYSSGSGLCRCCLSNQVRTNTTLEQQWVEVARELVKEQHLKIQLLNLCIEDTRFSYKVVEVTQEGGLRLEGRVAHAQIFRDPNDQTWQYHTEKYRGCSRCQHFCCEHNHKRVHQRGFCHLEVLNNLCIPLTANVIIESYVKTEEVTSGIIPVHIRSYGCLIQPPAVLENKEDCADCVQDMDGAVHLPLDCIHFVLPQDVFLVLWGDARKRSMGTVVVMVCVGRTGLGPGRQLHKVGVLLFSSEVANAIFSTESSTQFILGGFGQDVADSWKSSAKKYGVQCDGTCIFHVIDMPSC